MRSLDERRSEQAASISMQRLTEALHAALPARALCSYELLEGGSTNLNYLLRFTGDEPPVVMRIYVRDPSACGKEAALLRALSGIAPVPELLHVSPTREGDLNPYLLYGYVEGITFQELKKKGDRDEIAEASHAIWKDSCAHEQGRARCFGRGCSTAAS
jgi:hypothetical protein